MYPLNANKCLSCGWEEHDDPEVKREICPECGAEFQEKQLTHIFGYPAGDNSNDQYKKVVHFDADDLNDIGSVPLKPP